MELNNTLKWMPQYCTKSFFVLFFCSSAVMFLTSCSEKVTIKTPPPKVTRSDLMGAVKYYKVQKGDTLSSIGYRSGHHYKQLAEWNEIPPPYIIKVGQLLKLFKLNKVLTTNNALAKKSVVARKNNKVKQKNIIISRDNEKLLKLYWQWPIKGRILRSYAQTSFKGIDIQGKKGQFVKAAAKGKIVYSGGGLIGYGNLLIIKHSEQLLSAYANNKRLLVTEGQRVKKGQVIAEMGQNDKHKYALHFEIRKNGKPVNPWNYLP